MNPEFWRGKRVFITGHTGFKGSWLCLWLQSAGAKLTGYALQPPTDPSLFEMCNIAERMTSVVGDVRDAEHLHRTLAACRPEIVIHMAAQPIVRKSYEIPVETFHTNVLGTVHLLDAIRRAPGVRAVVVVTSDKCYLNREWYWGYREKSPLGGDDPYSASKACAEHAFAAYSKSFFNAEKYDQHKVALATARAGNVIGGGDWAPDRLVPDAMRALLADQTISVRYPHATRPWQHVLEPLSGYLVLAESLYNDGPRCNGSWNFGPNEASEKPVSWIIDQLSELWGSPLAAEHDTAHHPHENRYLKLDVSKARALLGWKPQLDLETTLSWIVDWTKQFQIGANMREVTLDQIERFAGVAKNVVRVLATSLSLIPA